MSGNLTEYLLKSRTPLELACELAAQAKENAALKDRIHALKHELFWMRVAEHELAAAPSKGAS